MAATSEPVPQNLADVTALLTALPGFAEVLQALRSGRSAAVDGRVGFVLRSRFQHWPVLSRIAMC